MPGKYTRPFISFTSSNSDKSPSRSKFPSEREKVKNSLFETSCKDLAIVELAPISNVLP